MGYTFPLTVSVSVLQRNRTSRRHIYVYMEREGIYSKELAHIIMETDKSSDLQGEWMGPS